MRKRKREEPKKPLKVDELIKEIEKFRNFYWNLRRERRIIPEWQDIGALQKWEP